MAGVESLSRSNCPQQTSVSFRKNDAIPKPDKIKERPDSYELTYYTDASTGKKIGVGVASAIIPGLGQAINGQWGKAAAFFATEIVLEIINPRKNLFAGLGLIGLKIGAAFDAVKSAESEIKQIVAKDSKNINIKA